MAQDLSRDRPRQVQSSATFESFPSKNLRWTRCAERRGRKLSADRGMLQQAVGFVFFFCDESKDAMVPGTGKMLSFVGFVVRCVLT